MVEGHPGRSAFERMQAQEDGGPRRGFEPMAIAGWLEQGIQVT